MNEHSGSVEMSLKAASLILTERLTESFVASKYATGLKWCNTISVLK